MTASGYSPAREFKQKWWSERLKPFLDFKSYLTQRRTILSRPEQMLEAHDPNDKHWKSPLAFALQGLVVPTILFSLIVAVYFFVVREPEPAWKVNQQQYSENLRQLHDLEKQIDAAPSYQTFTFQDDFVVRDRADALQECRRRITTLESRAWIFNASPHVDAAERKIQRFLSPMMLILAAYFFRRFLRTGQGRSGANMDRAHEVYLYFVTSCIFWVALFQSTCLVLLLLAARTGKDYLFGPLMLSQTILGIIGLIMLNKECKKLTPIFGLPLLEGKARKKSGHHKIFSTIFYSNLLSLVVSYLVLIIAAWGIGLVVFWFNQFRVT